jgi:hypothetical protein
MPWDFVCLVRHVDRLVARERGKKIHKFYQNQNNIFESSHDISAASFWTSPSKGAATQIGKKPQQIIIEDLPRGKYT